MRKRNRIGLAAAIPLALASLSICAAREPSSPVYNIDPFLEMAPEWIEQFRVSDRPGAYSYRPGGKRPDLYGSTDVFYLLFTLDMLDLDEAERAEWAKTIQGFQHEPTGYFRDFSTFHSREHQTAYAVGALKLLGSKPAHPQKYKSRYDTPEKIEAMLEAVRWDIIWSGSHEPSGIASALYNTGEIDDEWMAVYFDWLDREVDPATGYWIRGPAAEPGTFSKEEMGGAFHFYYLYAYLDRPLPYPERIIDATISIQGENGLWDADVPYCIDLDGVFSIIEAYKQTDEYRRDAVYAALEKALAAIATRLNDRDFVFANYIDSHKLVGAVAALAELQAFMPDRLETPEPLVSILKLSPFI